MEEVAELPLLFLGFFSFVFLVILTGGGGGKVKGGDKGKRE